MKLQRAGLGRDDREADRPPRATETSTLSFIGVPAGAYAGNMTFLQIALGYIVGRLLVSVLFIPAYFRGEL